MQHEIMLSTIGWTLAFIGSLFILIGGLVAYIFKQHTAENRVLFAENKSEHNRIYDAISMKKDK